MSDIWSMIKEHMRCARNRVKKKFKVFEKYFNLSLKWLNWLIRVYNIKCRIKRKHVYTCVILYVSINKGIDLYNFYQNFDKVFFCVTYRYNHEGVMTSYQEYSVYSMLKVYTYEDLVRGFIYKYICNCKCRFCGNEDVEL